MELNQLLSLDKNGVKKELYRQNPNAELEFIRKGIVHYQTLLFDDSEVDSKTIFFEVPVSDMGDADFFHTMPAKLLIRWLV